jgi:hypothetical protein
MSDLNADQLEAIRRLLIEPLREAVRQEIRLSHQRLAATVEKLDERLADHGRRLVVVERSTAQFRSFRRRVVTVYGVLTVILGVAWSLFREKLLAKLMGP